MNLENIYYSIQVRYNNMQKKKREIYLKWDDNVHWDDYDFKKLY